MDDWSSWHSVLSTVYHWILVAEPVTTSRTILTPGRGGRRKCLECRPRRRSIQEALDLSGATFDRKLDDGTTRPFFWGVALPANGGRRQQPQRVGELLQDPRFNNFGFELGDIGGTEMRLEPAGDALGHWWKPYFEDDLDRARALGLTCYRLSVEWSRVEPAAPAWVTDWITANNGKASNDVAGPPAKLDPAVFDAKALARYREMVGRDPSPRYGATGNSQPHGYARLGAADT